MQWWCSAYGAKELCHLACLGEACVACVWKAKEIKGFLCAWEKRGARKEGGRETPARRLLLFAFFTRQMLKSWLVMQSSKHVNHSLNTLIRLVETCSSFLNSADLTLEAWNTVEARRLWEYWWHSMSRGCHVNTVFTVGKELGSILLHHAYPDTCSGFKTFHPGERIQNGADQHRMCVDGLAVSERKRCGFKSIRIRVDGAYKERSNLEFLCIWCVSWRDC